MVESFVLFLFSYCFDIVIINILVPVFSFRLVKVCFPKLIIYLTLPFSLALVCMDKIWN